MTMRRTGGGTGTNQYRTRGCSTRRTSAPVPAQPTASQCRCGDIWASDCPVPLHGPTWRHEPHKYFPLREDVRIPATILTDLNNSSDEVVRKIVAKTHFAS